MIKQGDISSARTKVDEIKQAGGDASELSAEIERAAAAQKSAAQYETSYQQVVQKYQRVAADDKNGLQGALADFQSIAQCGGPRAAQANQYINEINSKLTSLRANEAAKASAALNKPVAPPPPPVTKPDLPSTKAVDEAAVRDVIKRYELALNAGNADALLTVWPAMRYGKYKELFKNREANHMTVSTQVEVETLNISESGEEATLTATLLVNSSSKSNGTQSRREPAVFRLVKKSAGWVISEVQ